MNILFVVSRFGSHRSGGHVLSAASIGKALVKLGHKVHFAFNSEIQPEYLVSTGIKVFYVPVASTSRAVLRFLSGYWSRAWRLLALLRREKYDLVIAMDRLAAWHTSPAACIQRVPMIPVIAGGANVDGAFTHTSTILFSRENRTALLRLGWKPNSIIVSEGRIDFSEFLPQGLRRCTPQLSAVKMLYLTRFATDKWTAFESFVRELDHLSLPSLGVAKLEVDVAGDGPQSAAWRQFTSQRVLPPEIHVNFLGYKRITGDFLRRYTLVVTMGRGILEAIASGVPAAISGHEGYKGLVTSGNLDLFARTNFTGRSVLDGSNLARDLERVLRGSVDDSRLNLESLVRERYSSESGARRILQCFDEMGAELIPGNGNVSRLAILHFRELRRLILKSSQRIAKSRPRGV